MTRTYGRKIAVILTTVSMIAAAVPGCGQGKYEKMEVASEETIGEMPEAEESGQVKMSAAEKAGEGAQPEISPSDRERAMAPAPAFTDVSDTVYIKGNQVRLRTAPDTGDDQNIAAVVNIGTALTRTGDSDDWCRINYQGQILYVSKGLVSSQQPQTTQETSAAAQTTVSQSGVSQISLDAGWKYADFSAIKSGTATLYRSESAGRKGITVCVNAGHGTSGGGSVKTQCHPDGTPKVTGGTTGAGATKAIAVSSGMTFLDGTPEAKVTLALAKVFKEKLLAAGYDVLMIREGDDVQLDNIARTVLANNMADCHIALHWDSTENNKGAFFMSVPNVASYRAMEPVASNWQKHQALGENLVAGLKGAGVKIFSGGSMEMDLTQTSYSTVPSIDIELGDKASDHSAGTLDVLASGLLAGVNGYFGKE